MAEGNEINARLDRVEADIRALKDETQKVARAVAAAAGAAPPDAAGAPQPGATLETYRALFAEAGSMARHYSTVRMGLTTFLIGISLAIMNFKWNDVDLFFLVAAGVTWALAVGLFIEFTRHESAELIRRRKDLHELEKSLGKEVTPPKEWKDGNKLLHLTPGNVDGARIAFALLTLAFIAGCVWWWNHDPNTPAARVTLEQTTPVQAEIVTPVPITMPDADVDEAAPPTGEAPSQEAPTGEAPTGESPTNAGDG